ncbi:MAG TPA: hypothetical protein VF216_07610, partial [Mizugakiibacter sp.]
GFDTPKRLLIVIDNCEHLADGFDTVGRLLTVPDATPLFAYPDDWRAALEAALAKLARLAPESKELVVRALVRAIGADGVVSVAEAELLRVVCAALHCPLPPLLPAAA